MTSHCNFDVFLETVRTRAAPRAPSTPAIIRQMLLSLKSGPISASSLVADTARAIAARETEIEPILENLIRSGAIERRADGHLGLCAFVRKALNCFDPASC